MTESDVETASGAGPDPLPEEFDPAYYVSENSDLSGFDASAALSHFSHYGIAEGRAGSAYCFRSRFLTLVEPSHATLEIGPFCGPCVRGDHVRYFDVMSREGLIRRANEHGYDYTDAPVIDYVSSVGDLGIVTDRFRQVVSSHCIEHQPDLVRHLQSVERILEPRGRYLLIAPDKRFCFDHFIPLSNIADVVGAYCDRRVLHSAADVLEHESMTTHNDHLRHWAGDHGEPHWARPGGYDRFRNTFDLIGRSSGKYLDTHAWQFTPDSFRAIVRDIASLGLTGLSVTRVFNTPRYCNEFAAVLERAE